MGKIEVILDPEKRKEYIDELLKKDNLSHIDEDSLAAYCPISLTLTPKELKPYLQERQDVLMKGVLASAGITAYDPASAPYSPDKNLKSTPQEVYLVDSGKIVGARFFVGHNIFSSTGFGVEAEKAKFYNRISVILMDKNIRVSRMQPNKAIYLQYDNFEEQANEFKPVFEMLTNYNPGMGFNDGVPVLLGFEKDTNKVVDLEEEVYKNFSNLQYYYNGKIPIIELRTKNPEIFYETSQKHKGVKLKIV